MTEHQPKYGPEQATVPEAPVESAKADEDLSATKADDEPFLEGQVLTFQIPKRVGNEIRIEVVSRRPQISRSFVEVANAEAVRSRGEPIFGSWDDVDLEERRAEIAARRDKPGVFVGLLRRLGVAF